MSETNSIGDCAEWIFPDFGNMHSPTIKKTAAHGLPTAEEIEHIYQDARKEGYKNGYDAGIDAAKNEINASIAAMTEFMQILQEPYKQISSDVIETIKHIAIIIAGQIIRREINIDDKNIIAAINKSLSLVDEIEKPLSIHVNPGDVSIVKEYLSHMGKGIKFIEDVTIARGGCRIDTSVSVIDATIEAQITEISATLFGGSRIEDD